MLSKTYLFCLLHIRVSLVCLSNGSTCDWPGNAWKYRTRIGWILLSYSTWKSNEKKTHKKYLLTCNKGHAYSGEWSYELKALSSLAFSLALEPLSLPYNLTDFLTQKALQHPLETFLLCNRGWEYSYFVQNRRFPFFCYWGEAYWIGHYPKKFDLPCKKCFFRVWRKKIAWTLSDFHLSTKVLGTESKGLAQKRINFP